MVSGKQAAIGFFLVGVVLFVVMRSLAGTVSSQTDSATSGQLEGVKGELKLLKNELHSYFEKQKATLSSLHSKVSLSHVDRLRLPNGVKVCHTFDACQAYCAANPLAPHERLP